MHTFLWRNMQQTINKEIKEYTESIFFGLLMRQFIFSLGACALTVIIYFASYSKLGNEISSWLCIAVYVPFIAFGYLRMNGMYVPGLGF